MLASALLRRIVPIGAVADVNALGSLLVADDVTADTFDGAPLVTAADVAAAVAALASALAAIAFSGSASDLGTGTLPIARIADGSITQAKLAAFLAAIATSGSASDLGTGTLPIARIADGAVTLAKLVSASSGGLMIGRKTTGSGAWEEISPGWFSPVVDFKTTGVTAIIPPCPFRLDAARMDYVPTTIAATTVGPTTSIGSNSASFNNWQSSGVIAGFTSTGAFGRIAATAVATNVIDLTTSGLQLNVTGAATATTCQGRVVVSGALLPV